MCSRSDGVVQNSSIGSLLMEFVFAWHYWSVVKQQSQPQGVDKSEQASRAVAREHMKPELPPAPASLLLAPPMPSHPAAAPLSPLQFPSLEVPASIPAMHPTAMQAPSLLSLPPSTPTVSMMEGQLVLPVSAALSAPLDMPMMSPVSLPPVSIPPPV